ncbi:tachykinin-4 [Sorex araneus]|uniref:tachykinin-4 n=1 Tax=Sorex araneus TaxID=42254 RepID=UPI002433D47D|nr:tachykinin-4 [Sorex araneus]
MLPGLALLFLTGLSACAVAPDKELVLSEEARPWITITLEEGALPSIQLQLQEVKRGKARQFFGLMGKRVRGYPPIQLERTGHQQGQLPQDLAGRTGPSAEGLSPGRGDEEQGSE